MAGTGHITRVGPKRSLCRYTGTGTDTGQCRYIYITVGQVNKPSQNTQGKSPFNIVGDICKYKLNGRTF